MSGLFAALARRGAGVAPEAGAAPLIGLRPRTRFEPMPGLPEAAGERFVAGVEAPAAPRPFSEIPAARAAGRIDERARPRAARDAPSAPPHMSLAIREPAQSPPEPSIAPPRPAALAPATATAAPRDNPAPPPVEPILSPALLPAAAELPVAPEPPGPLASPEARMDQSAVQAPALPGPPAAASPAPPAVTATRLPAIPEFQPEPAPLVTIAIDRIDIALAPPPAPPVRAPAEIGRSRGFAAYARARRGVPR